MKTKPNIKPKRLKFNKFTGEFKPHVIPDDMVLIVDTREQLPLFTPPPQGLVLTRDTLHNGDYSIRGFEDRIAVERKGVSDFLTYITVEREKTQKKLDRMKSFDFKALVIEEDEDMLYFASPYSAVSPEAIRQSLVSMQIRYGLHLYMSSDRKKIERMVLDWFIKYFNVKREAR